MTCKSREKRRSSRLMECWHNCRLTARRGTSLWCPDLVSSKSLISRPKNRWQMSSLNKSTSSITCRSHQMTNMFWFLRKDKTFTAFISRIQPSQYFYTPLKLVSKLKASFSAQMASMLSQVVLPRNHLSSSTILLSKS